MEAEAPDLAILGDRDPLTTVRGADPLMRLSPRLVHPRHLWRGACAFYLVSTRDPAGVARAF